MHKIRLCDTSAQWCILIIIKILTVWMNLLQITFLSPLKQATFGLKMKTAWLCKSWLGYCTAFHFHWNENITRNMANCEQFIWFYLNLLAFKTKINNTEHQPKYFQVCISLILQKCHINENKVSTSIFQLTSVKIKCQNVNSVTIYN